MLSSPDVNPGDVVVNRCGQQGTVIAWVPTHNALAVLTDAEPASQLWDEWALADTEVKELYSAEIRGLAKDKESLREAVNALVTQRTELLLEIENMKAHVAALKANPITAEALKLVESGVKVLVDEHGNIEEYEHIPRHDKAHRLLWMQLVPAKRYGKYSWMINSYSDGSGSDRVVWPFADMEEAHRFAAKIVEDQILAAIPRINAEAASMAEPRGPAPAGAVPSLPIQTMHTRLEMWNREAGRAAMHKVVVPEAYIDAVLNYKLALAKLEAEQAQAKAEAAISYHLMLKGSDQ